MKAEASDYVSSNGRNRRLLVVGGEARNLPRNFSEIADFTQVTQDHNEVPASAVPFEAVIVITRWVSNGLWGSARTFASKRQIPLVCVSTGNYLLSKLEEAGFLTKKPKKNNAASEPKVIETELPGISADPRNADGATLYSPDEMTSAGVPATVLFDAYATQLREAFKALGKPGEFVDKETAFQIIREAVGIGEKEFQVILPECRLARLYSDADKKIRLLGEGAEYEPSAPADTKRAGEKEQKRPEAPRHRLVKLIPKLPIPEFSGPFGAAKILPYFKEFWIDGAPMSRETYRRIIKDALEQGLMEKLESGSIRIKLFSEEKLIPIRPLPDMAEAKTSKPVDQKRVEEVFQDAMNLRKAIGRLPSVEFRTEGMKKFERLLNVSDYDRFGAQAALARLLIPETPFTLERMLEYSTAFSDVEWAHMVWEILKRKTLQEVCLLLRPPAVELKTAQV